MGLPGISLIRKSKRPKRGAECIFNGLTCRACNSPSGWIEGLPRQFHRHGFWKTAPLWGRAKGCQRIPCNLKLGQGAVACHVQGMVQQALGILGSLQADIGHAQMKLGQRVIG